MTDYDTDETTGEVVRYEPPVPVRRDMRNPVTDSWTEVVRATSILAEQIAGTEFVPESLRDSPAKVTAAILYGRELGLPPMTGLGSVHVIKGKAGISAEQMRALVLQAGHEISFHEVNSVRVVLRGRRRGDDAWTTVEYSMADAQKSGDAKQNRNYQSRPVEMLTARATTRLCRMIFPDVIHGMRSVEELHDMADDEQPAEPAADPAKPRQTVRRQARREEPRAVEPRKAAPAEDGPSAAEQTKPGTVRRQTRREAPRGRTASGSSDDGSATDGPGEGSPSRDGGKPADDRGIDPAEPSRDAAPDPKISTAQRTTLQMHFKRIGIEDRAERLYWTGVAAGRGEKAGLGSTNDLSGPEARDAINRLERLKDREALEAMGAALADETGGES